MLPPKLNHFLGLDDEFYFRLGQIVSLDGKLYQHQARYTDSFGCQLIGHFLLDEQDFQVEMTDSTLSSFRIACESLQERVRRANYREARKHLSPFSRGEP